MAAGLAHAAPTFVFAFRNSTFFLLMLQVGHPFCLAFFSSSSPSFLHPTLEEEWKDFALILQSQEVMRLPK